MISHAAFLRPFAHVELVQFGTDGCDSLPPPHVSNVCSSVLTGCGDVQCANFVRAHKVWRHITYPGGVVPQSEIVTQMQRLSVQPGKTNKGAEQH